MEIPVCIFSLRNLCNVQFHVDHILLSYEGSAQGKWLHTLYDAPDCEYKPEFIIGGRDVAPAPACVYQIFRLYEEAAVTYDGHQLNVHPEGIPAYIWNGAWIPE